MRDVFRLLGSARELRPYYLGIVLASILTAATALAVPFVIKAATDEAVAQATHAPGAAEDGVRRILLLALLLFAADLANTLITNVGGYLGDVMAARLRAIMSRRYFAHLLRLPQRYFDDELTGTVVNRLSRSITETTQFLQAFCNNFFPMLITMGAVVAISGYYAWPLALLLLVLFPTFMWLTTLTTRRWQVLEGRKNAELDAAGGRFAEVIGQIRVVKSFVQERRELGVFEGRYAETIGITRTQSRFWHLMDTARRGALNLIFLAIYAIIFVRTVQGAFTIGVMVLLVQLVTMARQPVTMMSFLVDAGQHAVAGTRSYLDVLALPPEQNAPGRSPGQTAIPPGPTAISFEDVSFGYGDTGAVTGPGTGGVTGAESSAESAAEVLRGVSFAVPAARRVALVSESGGGKTTLVSLLLGLYRPQRGRILLGGIDLADLPVEAVRGAVGVVFQDPSLFSGTIAENIAYARPDATPEEVRVAAERANAHPFVARFADGYESLIGERGLKLSGGQKQRIAVARAILKDAPVLVLDEATSSLDSKAERQVQAGLEALMRDRTTLIIAHRLSTISSVDTIVTLRDGRVDEIGSPEELSGTGGIYAELLALQESGTRRDKRRLAAYDITG